MLSVIIATRNEKLTAFTVRRIRETSRVPTEIIVVDDDSSMLDIEKTPDLTVIRNETSYGSGYSKHRGIMAASNDTCLVVDAHMNFHDDNWSDLIVKYNKNYTDHIACTKSLVLTEKSMEMDSAVDCNWGAHILSNMIDQEADRYRVLAAKWNTRKKVGETGCVLGANYVLSRQRYIDVLGAPWQFLTGWGSEEELLSIVNWIMGGRNTLLDIEIGHMYRTGQYHLVPYKTQKWKILHNQIFLVQSVVDERKDREKLIDWLNRNENSLVKTAWRHIEKGGSHKYAEFVKERKKRTWAEYKTKWMDCSKTY